MTFHNGIGGIRSDGRFSSTKIPVGSSPSASRVSCSNKLVNSDARFRFLVRRIGKNDPEGLSGLLGSKERKDILFANTAFQFRPGKVPLDGRDRRGILVHEQEPTPPRG